MCLVFLFVGTKAAIKDVVLHDDGRIRCSIWCLLTKGNRILV